MSIHKEKSGRWGARIDLDRGADGRRRQKKLGTFRTQKEAQAAERAALSARERGIDMSPAAVTVTELVTRYIENRRVMGRGLKTIEEYESKLRLYIVPHLGTVKVAKLNKVMVSAWIAKISQSGGTGGVAIGPKSVKHAYGLLSSALTWGMTLDLVSRNVCVGVKPPPVPRTPVTALSDDERDAVSDAAESSRWGNFIAISFLLGSRRGETLALNRSDVDFERGEVTISKSMSDTKTKIFVTHTKTDRVRVVSLHPEALALFRKQFAQQAADRLRAGEKYVIDPAGPIFTDELGARLKPLAATYAYREIARRAGISSTKLHSSRHTTATLLIRLGVDIVTVAGILGHANPNVTLSVYGHLVPGAKREAANLLANHLESTRRKKTAES